MIFKRNKKKTELVNDSQFSPEILSVIENISVNDTPKKDKAEKAKKAEKPDNTGKVKPERKKSAKELDRERLRKKEVKQTKRKLVKKRNVPKTAQQTIPYIKVCDDSIIEVEKGRYSRTYEFDDVNYQIAKQADQEDIFLRYCSILNSFDTTVDVQITILNNKVNKANFENKVLLKRKDDDYDVFRKEYNDMLLEKISQGQNEILRKKYLSISVVAENLQIARNKFSSFETELSANFKRLGSNLNELSSNERISVLKDVFRGVDIAIPEMSIKDFARGADKGYVSPDYFEFKNDYFMFENKYARCLFIRDFPSFLSDKLISDLTDTGFNMLLSINIQPVDPHVAIKVVKRQLTSMEANKLQAQRKAVQSGYTSELISHDLQYSLQEAEELLDDLRNKNQKMFMVNCVIMHMADSHDELNQDTETLKAVARKYLCNLGVLKFQQEDAMASALPLGYSRLKVRRTLTTESTAILMPFNTQELIQSNGMYYGLNAVSRNMIMFNRINLKNPNGFILGSPGSGKSFSAKREMVNILLNTDDDVIIIDPEREYTNLGLNFKGEIINISAGSKNYINPLDMTQDYSDDDNPIVLKSEFVLSLCECLIGGAYGLSAKEKAIIDRCVQLTYVEYMQDFDPAKVPTLKDFHRQLTLQAEPEAKAIALSLELYTKGSLSIFANKTNININNRFVIFDIKDLGKQLKTMGMLIVLDNIWNRITENRAKGKRTWIYMDEIYLLFNNEYSANFLFELYKRARKWGGVPTGITQNVEDLLRSELARRMLSNSDFIMMLNQAPSDRAELAKLLNISDNQLSYVTNSEAGQGLLFCGNSIIPFIDKFPKNTKLYQMMTTKIEEQ